MEPWIIWLIVSLLLFISEMITPGAFFFACLGLGALLSSIISYLRAPAWLVWTNFFASSIIFVLIARPLAKKLMKGENRPSNVDELVGKEALVIESIVPPKSGLVKIRGESWRAESSEELTANSLVEIVKVDGNHLIVKKK